jgi:hypothetical protein
MTGVLRHLLATATLLASMAAVAGGSGTLYMDGKATPLTSAYAFRAADPFDDKARITTVVFSDKPIDAAALTEEADRGEALADQLRASQATRVELNLQDDGSVQDVNIAAPGSSASQSGSGWYTLELAHHDARRVEGSFRSKDEADKKNGHYFDLAFALDLAPPPSPGAPLPADGGEPAKAYRAYLAAMDKGDIDALLKTMSRERAAQIAAHRDEPEFKTMFAFIQTQRLRNPKLGKGSVKGDRATLEVSGKDGDGNASTGSVTLLRQDGAWRLDKEAMSTKVH